MAGRKKALDYEQMLTRYYYDIVTDSHEEKDYNTEQVRYHDDGYFSKAG
jgi:hypothetical protein